MASSPITSWQIDGETVADCILGGSKITADSDSSHEIKNTYSLEKDYDQPRQHIKKQRHYFANKVLSSQSDGFPSSHVWMWEKWRKWKWSLSVMSNSLQPMNCTPPGSSLHGILQARVLERGAISFSRGSSRPRDQNWVSHIPGRRFNLWATREAPGCENWTIKKAEHQRIDAFELWC